MPVVCADYRHTSIVDSSLVRRASRSLLSLYLSLSLPAGSPEVLKSALREIFHLTIFRNEHYNVYEEYERLFSDFKVPKIKFKLSKFKDIFKVR